MKKILILAVAAMAVSSAFAYPYYTALLDACACDSETLGIAENYSAYLWTVSEAQSYLGEQSSADAIAGYLEKNGVQYDNLKSSSKAMDIYGYDPADNMYSFWKQITEGQSGTEYLALVTYLDGQEGERFNVFTGSVDADGDLYFDPDNVSASSGWTTAVPEPTSAMLLLFGLAGLALKRNK